MWQTIALYVFCFLALWFGARGIWKPTDFRERWILGPFLVAGSVTTLTIVTWALIGNSLWSE